MSMPAVKTITPVPARGLPATGVVDQEDRAPIEGRSFDEHGEATRQHQSDGEPSGPLSLTAAGSGLRDQTSGIQGGTETYHGGGEELRT